MNLSQPYQTDSPVYNHVLSLLRSSLWGETRFPYQAPIDAAWGEIYRELKHQTVQHLCVDLLAREDPEHSQQYISHAAKNMMHWYKILQEQQRLCGLLCDAGIPCAVVKGAAAASHYPQPSNRLMGDIDLLVDPADFDHACLLVSDGSEFLGESFRHKKYRWNNIIIEIHRAFSTLRNPEKRDYFDQRVFGTIKAAEPVSIDNHTFFRLPKIENGLILLEHIDMHMENGLGLRQIIDWMMYVDQELTDEVWQTHFAPFIRQLDRETLAVTVTRMCQMYLGLRTDITWCAGADEELCRKLMEYILYQGNFGRKNQSGSNRAANIISASRNPFSFLRILQHRGSQHWKALNRYPFLRPFAWLYQIVHYIHRGICSDHPIRLLLQAVKHSKSQTDFLDALGVSRIAEEGK